MNFDNKSPKWFYLFTIIIPVLFFVLFELILRIFNYGRNDDQWINVTESKQMLNPEISGRYFFILKDLPQSNNDVFDIVKRKNAYRVFVMGESSAAGFPFSPNGTFSRYIRDRLELRYPEVHIEVINLAITATNSYTIRDLLPEVIEQAPDLIIIYAGHNEYYGALGVGSNENIGNSREFVNFLIWLNKFKTVELLRNIFSAVAEIFGDDANQNRTGTLMSRIVNEQLITFNSELFDEGLKQFEGNLEDILMIIRNENIPVIISSQVSNLKDQKPFESVDTDENISANLAYEEAVLQIQMGNEKRADSLYRLAKDFDALRFRAPEKINLIIKKLAQKYQSGFVNIDSVFNATSPDGIVGNDLIVDHLHPSLDGYQLMGKIYFEEMLKSDILSETDHSQFSKLNEDSIVVSNFAFSKLDSSIARIRLKGLLSNWPFVKNPDFSFLKSIILKDKIDSLAYKVAVENMDWEKSHREAAAYYLSKKDYINFAKEFRVIVSQYPYRLTDYDFVSSQLINVKEYNFAYDFLLKRFKESPDEFSAKWLGNINLNNGNIDKAIKYLAESINYNSNDPQVFYNLTGAYIQKEDYKNALVSIEKCLELNSEFPNAVNLKTQLTNIMEK
ncbi:MAG: GDSL-type esterase/lipase family protein [Ignavibacteriales bacterium]